MIVNTSNSLERENYIARNVIELLNNSISSSKILVLTLNSFKKERLISKIENEFFTKKQIGIGMLNIYTSQGKSKPTFPFKILSDTKIVSIQLDNTVLRHVCYKEVQVA